RRLPRGVSDDGHRASVPTSPRRDRSGTATWPPCRDPAHARGWGMRRPPTRAQYRHVARVEEVPVADTRSTSATPGIRPLRIDAPDEELAAMRRRIAATRWPTRELVPDRSQ